MTKLLTISLLLLSCVVGEAGNDLKLDFNCTMVNGTCLEFLEICDEQDKRCLMYSSPFNPIVTCDENMKCWTPCEEKMREAMKMADGKLFNRPPYVPPHSIEEREQRHRDDKAAWEQWDKAMKECVLP